MEIYFPPFKMTNLCHKPTCELPKFKKCTPERELADWLDCWFDRISENSVIITEKSLGTTGFMTFREGHYKLDCPLIYKPIISGTSAISILHSNVVLDLNDFYIKQGNNAAMTFGIFVAPNVSNITIINGAITDFKARAIYVDGLSGTTSTVDTVFIKKIKALRNGDVGLEQYGSITLFGVTNAYILDVEAAYNTGAGVYLNTVRNVIINEANLSYSTSGEFNIFNVPGSAYGLLATGTSSGNLLVDNCVLNNNVGIYGKGAYFTNVLNDVYIRNTIASNNSGTSEAAGIDLRNVGNFSVVGSSACFNSLEGTNGTFLAGFAIRFGSGGGILENSIANNNSGQITTPNTTDSHGLFIQNNDNITVTNCQFANNTSLNGTVWGIEINGANNIVIENSSIQNNKASSATGGAINLASADNTILDHNKVLNNTTGISIDSVSNTTTVSNNITQNNGAFEVANNNGSTFFINNVFRGTVIGPFLPATSSPPVNNQIV